MFSVLIEEFYSLTTGRSLKPAIGMCMSMLLHIRCPKKIKLMQSMNGIELWRNGAQRRVGIYQFIWKSCIDFHSNNFFCLYFFKFNFQSLFQMFQHYNQIGLSMSRQTVMRLLSTLRVHADSDLMEMIREIEVPTYQHLLFFSDFQFH
jgi:hypothetical protein